MKKNDSLDALVHLIGVCIVTYWKQLALLLMVAALVLWFIHR